MRGIERVRGREGERGKLDREKERVNQLKVRRLSKWGGGCSISSSTC